METRYSIKTLTIKTKNPAESINSVRDPESVYRLASEIYARLDDDQEHFVVLALNKANGVTGFKVCHSGTIDQAPVSPAIIFRFAILFGACAIILVHNHPSGRTEPSREDLDITKKLSAGADLLGLKIIDHLILGADKFFSFREHGLI